MLMIVKMAENERMNGDVETRSSVVSTSTAAAAAAAADPSSSRRTCSTARRVGCTSTPRPSSASVPRGPAAGRSWSAVVDPDGSGPPSSVGRGPAAGRSWSASTVVVDQRGASDHSEGRRCAAAASRRTRRQLDVSETRPAHDRHTVDEVRAFFVVTRLMPNFHCFDLSCKKSATF